MSNSPGSNSLFPNYRPCSIVILLTLVPSIIILHVVPYLALLCHLSERREDKEVLNQGPFVWNKLSTEIKNSPSDPTFKTKLKQYLLDSYYSIKVYS